MHIRQEVVLNVLTNAEFIESISCKILHHTIFKLENPHFVQLDVATFLPAFQFAQV